MIKNEAWPFEVCHVNDYAWIDDFLNPEECNKLIKKGLKEGLKKALTGKNGDTNDNVRESEISWVYNDEETLWFYEKLVSNIIYLNNKYFKFDLWGIAESLQFTNYKFPNGHYGKHIDSGFGIKIRKLSVVILLSDPKKFEGGEFCLYNGSEKGIVFEKKQGKLIVFPSYMLHEVKPVTSGERNSLVAWITGPNFK
jgi:PKHD-type hydroxylase